MHFGGRKIVAIFALATVCSVAATPAFASGFNIFEQGSKAMGMAGAFTAQADDPSALFHNVGGLAFFDDKEFAVGFTYITNSEADYEGLPPVATGFLAEQETLAEAPPHFYWVQPINDTWKFGLAVNAPYGLTTEWKDPDRFPGRFISTRAALTAIDVNPNLGWQLSPKLGIGFGAIFRFSEIELERRQAAFNPFTLSATDVSALELKSDFDEGIGWQAGFLYRANDSFSWGFVYRSKVEIDYGGDATFTQILTGFPQFDGGVAASIPFGRAIPIDTKIEFPDTASLGVAMALSPNWLLELDANWAGWSSFNETDIIFTDGSLPTTTIISRWDDVNNYRVGFLYRKRSGSEWRFGYVFDENPIPDETLGPLLPDSDRNGYTIGYGHKGNRVGLDLALMYLPFDERSTVVSENGFNGSYQTTAWLLGATLGW